MKVGDVVKLKYTKSHKIGVIIEIVSKGEAMARGWLDCNVLVLWNDVPKVIQEEALEVAYESG